MREFENFVVDGELVIGSFDNDGMMRMQLFDQHGGFAQKWLTKEEVERLISFLQEQLKTK